MFLLHLFQYLYVTFHGYIIFVIFPVVTETAGKVFHVALKFCQIKTC